MDGKWTTQIQMLNDTLFEVLNRIKSNNLPPEQLAYLINAILIPKLAYPLNVLGINTGQDEPGATALDNKIEHFVKEYLWMNRGHNHACIHVATSKWGLGVNSILDVMKTNTITNTMLTLNDWTSTTDWMLQLRSAEQSTDTT